VAEVRPADVVSRPVPLPVYGIPDELLVRHGRPGWRTRAAVIGDARIRAESRACQQRETDAGQDVPDTDQDLKVSGRSPGGRRRRHAGKAGKAYPMPPRVHGLSALVQAGQCCAVLAKVTGLATRVHHCVPDASGGVDDERAA
jgi:hypothetical protein